MGEHQILVSYNRGTQINLLNYSCGGCDLSVKKRCRFYDSDFGKMYSVQKKNEPHEAEKERGKLK